MTISELDIAIAIVCAVLHDDLYAFDVDSFRTRLNSDPRLQYVHAAAAPSMQNWSLSHLKDMQRGVCCIDIGWCQAL